MNLLKHQIYPCSFSLSLFLNLRPLIQKVYYWSFLVESCLISIKLLLFRFTFEALIFLHQCFIVYAILSEALKLLPEITVLAQIMLEERAFSWAFFVAVCFPVIPLLLDWIHCYFPQVTWYYLSSIQYGWLTFDCSMKIKRTKDCLLDSPNGLYLKWINEDCYHLSILKYLYPVNSC
jgi:hypothetical protein